MKKVILLFIITLSFSTVFAQSFGAVKGGHCYTLEVPNYMEKTFTLNEDATLQYQNTAKEAYVIVLDDDKDELKEYGMKFVDAHDFLDFFTKDYKKDAKVRKLGKASDFSINGNKCAQVDFSWEEEDENGIFNGYMLITAVETKGHFYKILCWTVNTNKDLLKEDFKKISQSLKD